MDKYEYKLKLEQLKNLVQEKDYKTAAEIADTVNWRKVKSAATLCTVAEIYDKEKRFEDSRDIYLMAYERSTVGRNIIYRLALAALKLGNIDEAKEYYDEFLEIAPYDNLKYVLRYEIARLTNAPREELISILEEYKERDYTEEWAFELAYLYHRAGNSKHCVEMCDELIVWFGDGKYVEKALELKMLYQPLNPQQEEKYRQFKQKKDAVVEVRPDDTLESGEIVREAVQIPEVTENHGKFNTLNLQKELAKSMRKIMEANSQDKVIDTMDNIKKMVEEIPYLKLPSEGEEAAKMEARYRHIESDEEIDGSLKINFKEILAEDYDGQIRLFMPENAITEPQVNGQMSIEEVLSEWEKTKRAAQAALEEAQKRKLDSAKARAMQEAENIMERLTGAMPRLDAGISTQELMSERYLQEEGLPDVLPEEQQFEVLPEEPQSDVLPEEPQLDVLPKQPQLDVLPEEPQLDIPPEDDLETLIEKQAQEIPSEMEEESLDADVRIPVRQETEMVFPEISQEPITELNQEQKEIFSYFISVTGMKQQLCQILEGILHRKGKNNSSSTGNILILGGRGSGKTVLATDIIKAVQKGGNYPPGKVGKITGVSMNQKDLSQLLKKVAGGYLIVEKAGDLSQETVTRLSLLMEQDTGGVLVIMEDTRAGIEKVMGRDASFAKKFTEKIKIPVFTIDELVEFAKAYSQEHECEIDDMGILALYNCISNIQRLDEATTLTEVKEIVDSAIERAGKGRFKKIFGGKKFSPEGFLYLREKDFEN